MMSHWYFLTRQIPQKTHVYYLDRCQYEVHFTMFNFMFNLPLFWIWKQLRLSFTGFLDKNILVNLKSNLALESNKGHNLFKSVFPSNKEPVTQMNLVFRCSVFRWLLYLLLCLKWPSLLNLKLVKLEFKFKIRNSEIC